MGAIMKLFLIVYSSVFIGIPAIIIFAIIVGLFKEQTTGIIKSDPLSTYSEKGDNTVIEQMSEIIIQLKKQRFSALQEKQTQNEVESFLGSSGYTFDREKRLSNRDIPDFFIKTMHGNIVLEVKTRCPKKAIFRQLERYAKHDDVHGLILLSGTSMGLPSDITGKPCAIVSLGEGWL